MVYASKVAAIAHERLCHSRDGVTEYRSESVIEGFSMQVRLGILPLPSLGGENATILHYTTNKDVCASDEATIDAGAEFRGYASDITRSWLISAHFRMRNEKSIACS